jgi:hypothetical protein
MSKTKISVVQWSRLENSYNAPSGSQPSSRFFFPYVVSLTVIRYSGLDRISVYLSHQAFAKLWRHLKLYIVTRRFPSKRDHAVPTPPSSRHKSLDEDSPLGADFRTMEYAIERKILEAPILELTYYADVVGDVPSLPHPGEKEPGDIGNGDIGPEWGIDLVVRGGFLRYGPWADRQR